MPSYNKTTWADRQVQFPSRYTLTDNGDGTLTLTPAPGTITSVGTPISAANMNKLEQGIKDALPKDGSEAMSGPLKLGKGGVIEDQESRTVLLANSDAFEVITENGLNYIFQANYNATAPVFKGNVCWHSGNDGSGSGLAAEQILSHRNNLIRVYSPIGGSYSYDDGNITGAIKITLPHSWTSTMMKMTVRVYNYSDGGAFDINLAGYNYVAGPGWTSTSAYIDGITGKEFDIRFGHDGTKCCIWIGEVGTNWTYPKVAISDFTAGFNGGFGINSEDWKSGWSVGIVQSFGTVNSVVKASTPWNANKIRFTNGFMEWNDNGTWKGAGGVKIVHLGTTTITAGTVGNIDVTIPAVNVSKSYVITTNTAWDGGDNNTFRVGAYLLNSTTLRFECYSTSSNFPVRWQVIESY